MNITKFGHCCLLIETKGLRILTDPGAFSTTQNTVENVDVVLITHEHGDHLHTDSLKEILKNNPHAKVVTNSGVGKILSGLGIPFELLEGRETTMVKEILIEAFDGKHEEIYEEFGQVQNTGYFIDNMLFYPGDSFFNPEKPINILALPVAGPWCNAHQFIAYALTVKPKKAFPVHDGVLHPERRVNIAWAEKLLPEHGIEFIDMKEGDTKEF